MNTINPVHCLINKVGLQEVIAIHRCTSLVEIASVHIQMVNGVGDWAEVSFADESSGVASFLQSVKIRSQRSTVVVLNDTILVDTVDRDMNTEQHGRSGRAANRADGVGIREEDSVTGQLIDVRRDCE
jgi:hypothetical protein